MTATNIKKIIERSSTSIDYIESSRTRQLMHKYSINTHPGGTRVTLCVYLDQNLASDRFVNRITC